MPTNESISEALEDYMQRFESIKEIIQKPKPINPLERYQSTAPCNLPGLMSDLLDGSEPTWSRSELYTYTDQAGDSPAAACTIRSDIATGTCPPTEFVSPKRQATLMPQEPLSTSKPNVESPVKKRKLELEDLDPCMIPTPSSPVKRRYSSVSST